MRKVDASDSPTERIDTGDTAEVVYDRNFELPVIQIQNTVWVEGPRYLAFTGTEPSREIHGMIAALEDLLKVIRRTNLPQPTTHTNPTR